MCSAPPSLGLLSSTKCTRGFGADTVIQSAHYFLIADSLSGLTLSRGQVVQARAECDLSNLLIFKCDAGPHVRLANCNLVFHLPFWQL
jgi:hypothetical protein